MTDATAKGPSDLKIKVFSTNRLHFSLSLRAADSPQILSRHVMPCALAGQVPSPFAVQGDIIRRKAPAGGRPGHFHP